MARVQMLHYIAGGRGDGTDWPPAGGTLDCDEREARDLVAGGNAKWTDEQFTVVPPPAPEPPAAAPAPPGAGDDPSEPENGSESDGKPRVRDPKEAWELHAMTVHGVAPDDARAMTKADLIARFGNPA